MTPQALTFSPKLSQRLNDIVSRYEQKQAAMLPVLAECQREFGYISPEVKNAVAEFLSVPVVKVEEVVSFYSLFNDKPIGRHHLQVCTNLSCVLRGAEELVAHLKEKLKIDVGQTTNDGKVTLSCVECLGACEIAPMMQVDEKYAGPLTKEKLDALIKELK